MRLITILAALGFAAGMTLTAQAQAQPAGGEGAGDSSKGLRPPKLKKFVEAVYPADKEKAGIGARVVLSIDVEESGRVGTVDVVAPAGPDFDAAAVVAASTEIPT